MDSEGTKHIIEVKRSAFGSYTTSFEAKIEDYKEDEFERWRTDLNLKTYLIDGKAFAIAEWDRTNLDNDSESWPQSGPKSSAHPALVKFDINRGRLSIETLEPAFLNPNFVPHYRVGESSGDSMNERNYIITATAEQLADFLSLIAKKPDAWSADLFDEMSLIKQPDPQSWLSWLWGLFWKIAFLAFCGWIIFGDGSKLFGWISNGSEKQIGSTGETNAGGQAEILRRPWVNDIIQLLMWTARSPLTSHERSLIKNIATSEAKRQDAPGEPVSLSSSEIDQLISGYEREFPGISDRMNFLAEPKNAALRTRIVKRVWQIIVHDGPASDEEVRLAMSIAVEFEMAEEEFLSISMRYHRPQLSDNEELDEARTLLEVSASATAEDIRRAYKRKAREYHPDAHAGVSENLKQLAAEHFKKLRNAQDLLLAFLESLRLVAKGADGRLVQVENLPDKVQCFSCAAIRPGTSQAEAVNARCPRCFTLLYHEPDFAAELNR